MNFLMDIVRLSSNIKLYYLVCWLVIYISELLLLQWGNNFFFGGGGGYGPAKLGSRNLHEYMYQQTNVL